MDIFPEIPFEVYIGALSGKLIFYTKNMVVPYVSKALNYIKVA